MTDAATPVTSRAVERFAEAYLSSLGAEIQRDGRRWHVTLPEDADTDLELDGAVLEVADESGAVSDDALALAPESSFVERMLEEAATRTPVGSLSLTSETCDVELPPWIEAGPVEVTNRSFTPYYDRRAVCVLFNVGIETVSEYQSEELHAVAVDCNDFEQRPGLAETVLELADDRPELSDGPTIDDGTLEDAIDAARTAVEDDVEPSVREIRERATRAADVELDEYRQYVRQRRDELRDEVDRLSVRIDEVTETIDGASEQGERVDALRERKELRSEREELQSELDELSEAIEAGFPEKRREIRERHALTVRIRPATVTAITYERGDLDLSLRSEAGSTDVSYSYGIGAGVSEEPACERCGRALTEENPLAIDGTSPIGAACCGDRESSPADSIE